MLSAGGLVWRRPADGDRMHSRRIEDPVAEGVAPERHQLLRVRAVKDDLDRRSWDHAPIFAELA